MRGTSLFLKRCLILLAMMSLWLPIMSGAQAPSQDLSAVVTVLSDGVVLQRAGAVNPLPLRVGSIAPLGAGDQLFTEINGRALISFTDDNTLYLLPDSRYTLTAYSALENDRFAVAGALYGIAVQTFSADTSDWEYSLVTPALTVSRPSEHFIVWGIPGRFETVISAVGTVLVQTDADPDGVEVAAEQGLMPAYDDSPITLESPYHAVELLALAIDCRGTISTGGSDGLRLRRGAALDYVVVGALQDGQAVNLVGITENGLWYRIPYLTGFGWLYSDLVETDENCPELPISPSLVGEANEIVAGASGEEVRLLSPFYGAPRDNSLFYR